MTVVPACECKLPCSHHSSGKCTRVADDDGLCDDSRKANLDHNMEQAKKSQQRNFGHYQLSEVKWQ